MSKKTDKRVMVTIVVKGDPSDRDDEGVAGRYGVEVSLSGVQDAPALSRVEAEALCEAALDAFHEKIGIECLDDFDIGVCFSEKVDELEIGAPEPDADAVASVDVSAVFLGAVE